MTRRRLRHGAAIAVVATVLVAWSLPVLSPMRWPARSGSPLPRRCHTFLPTDTPPRPQAQAPRAGGTALRALYGEAAPKSFFDPGQVDLATTVQQLRRFEQRERFVLPSSQIVVKLFSDGDVTTRPEVIDELFHAHLRRYELHDDVQTRARMRCYADVILGRRAFAGAVVNLYVPADPRMCLRHLRLVERNDEGNWSEHCDWGGITPPVVMTGWWGELRSTEFHMLIAPGVVTASDSQPHPRVARLLRHESDHLWDWMMGQAFRFSANERRAQAGDALVGRVYNAQGRHWPAPFSYPAAPPGAAS